MDSGTRTGMDNDDRTSCRGADSRNTVKVENLFGGQVFLTPSKFAEDFEVKFTQLLCLRARPGSQVEPVLEEGNKIRANGAI